ncbi:MAG: hydroxymethylglutaryl-CoA lyase [Myxococcales bacterium]|nr:hydroxymethylglutaryl-CoA lyase [Myxococcales bacterium]
MKDAAATDGRVSVYEVGLRDGLQNERGFVATADKARLLHALAAAGERRIELTSFVSPKWIPQLADAADLAKLVEAPEGVTLSALVPNAKGLERALATGIPEIAVFLSSSESHNKKNINKTIARTLEVFDEIVPPALQAGLRVRAYLSTVWGCPYEGPVPPAQAIGIAQKLLELGCYQVSLSDTIGVGNPRQTREILSRALDVMPAEKIAMHMHDTRGTALANVVVGLDMGIRDFDASIGGMGGCPYAPGASGNLATEDLVFMLDGMGMDTGIVLDDLIAAADLAEQIIGRPLPGKVHRAGPFKRRAS